MGLAVLASTVFTLVLLMLPSRYVKHSPPKETMNGVANEPKISVQVLVLGDIGRSPRMQYHAMSIAKHGGRVDMIGYQESTLHPGLIDNPLVSIVPLPPPPPILRANKLPFVIAGPLKVLWQIWSFILHTWIQHESFAMAISPEPSLDSHSLHRNNNLFPPEHAPHHRLA